MNLNRFIFPAPPSSYTASTIKKNLIWIERPKSLTASLYSSQPLTPKNNGKSNENQSRKENRDNNVHQRASTALTDQDISKELCISNSSKNRSKKIASPPIQHNNIYIEIEKDEKQGSAHSSPRDSLQDLINKDEEDKHEKKLKKKKSGCFDFLYRHKENKTPVNNEDRIELTRNGSVTSRSQLTKSVICGATPRSGGKTVKIPCYYFTAKCETQRTLLFFHSNGEDINLTSELLKFISEYLLVNILAVEYPGYGIYKGSPSEKTVLTDAEAAYDYLLNQLHVPEKDILVAGRSLGSGPATHLAATRKPGLLILISPFKSIKAVVKQSFGNLAQKFIKERFNNAAIIPEVKCPVFILHGKRDAMVLYTQSIELFNTIKGNKKLHLAEEMDHTSFDFFNDLIVPLKVFLEDLETLGKRSRSMRHVHHADTMREIR